MIREILELGNPVLRTPSAPVRDPDAPEIAALVTDLLDTLHAFQRRTGYGRGIAAPQIGVLKRVVVIDIPGKVGDGAGARSSARGGGRPPGPPAGQGNDRPAGLTFPLVLVNPIITDQSPETDLVWDACFSYWGFFFQVRRHRRVAVEYLAPSGASSDAPSGAPPGVPPAPSSGPRRRRLEAEGGLAELLQHEIEHLEGRLAIDLLEDKATLMTVREYEKHVATAP